MRRRILNGVLMASVVGLPVHSIAGPEIATGYNSYGYPGIIDMPVATSRPDGELAFTTSSFAGQTRNTLTFQLLPRLSGSFRYSILDNLTGGGTQTLYDRSFSLHFRFADEGVVRPALAVGLNDFLGTGVYSSEYIAATKTLGKSVRVTGGLGWGRLGSSGGFKNPLGLIHSGFETRPARNVGNGGTVHSAQFFRGDAAFFAGIEWQATQRFRLSAEYSSDAYPRETPAAFKRKSQLNFGATYKVTPSVDLSLRYLYGSEFGLQVTAALNPKNPPHYSGRDPAPLPVMLRDSKNATQLGWPSNLIEREGLRGDLKNTLAEQGIRLHGFDLSKTSARVEVENTAYQQEAQAVGRTARVLSRLMPKQVETFIIVPVVNGMPVSELRIQRRDMESLEHSLDNSWESFARTRISAAKGVSHPVQGRYPRFSWSLKPYLTPSLFDPDNPVRADLGAEVSATYQPMRGLEFSGAVRKKVIGNLDQATRKSNSVLPHVRSDYTLYDQQGDPSLTNLTAAYYFKPAKDLYGRITLGYLEQMYGGISTEVLWKRNESPFALGIEANYVKQRDFNQQFGFQNYEVATGHVSAYWDMGNGFHSQLDAGRYLAGDWGTTFSLDREFGNGWKIGAFATFTDVSFDRFGEGSFDKGIRITIPISWLTGEPNKDSYSTTIRPLTRDGGARLNVGGRLYERIRPLQKPGLQDGWGRFWR